jgi:hypothetical protein
MSAFAEAIVVIIVLSSFAWDEFYVQRNFLPENPNLYIVRTRCSNNKHPTYLLRIPILAFGLKFEVEIP